MSALRTLLRLRMRLAVTELRRSPARIAGALVGLAVFAGTAWASRALFVTLERTEPSLGTALVLIAFAAVGTFQIVAGMRWAVTSLYAGTDMELLLAAPIPAPALFAAKVLELATASWVSILLLVAVANGYGYAAGVPLPFVPALVATLTLAVGAALPGLLLTMLLARVVSAARLRAIFAFLPIALGIGFGLSGPAIGTIVERGSRPDVDALGDLATRALVAVEWIPTSWPASIVVGPATGEWAAAGGRLVLLVIALGALAAAAFATFRRTFYVTWGELTEGRRRSRRGVLERLAPPIAPSLQAIVVKDWRTTFRDAKSLANLFFPIAFAGYFALSAVIGQSQATTPFAAILILSSVGGMGLLAESKNITVLLSAPLAGRDLLVAKFTATFTPVVVAGAAIGVGAMIATERSLFGNVALMLVLIVVTGGVMLANLAAVGLWSDFTSERARLGIGPTFATFAISLTFGLGVLGVANWTARILAGTVTTAWHAIAVVSLLGAAGGVLAIATLARRAARRLDTMDAP